MFKKITCMIFIIQLSAICECFVPKFFGHDSAIIVDTDKTLAQNTYNALKFPTKTRMPPPFPMWRHYPRYHIIPPPPPGQILAINTWSNSGKVTSPFTPSAANIPIRNATTTTNTATPRPTTMLSITTLVPYLREDEFPAELLDIAQNKLGLRSLDEIPSISELGQLVGTNSPEETLKYIKKLALNEQGVALMKAYIESADYTDKTGELMDDIEDMKNEPAEEEDDDDVDDGDDDDDDDEMGDIEESLRVNDEGLVVVTDQDSNDDNEVNNNEELAQDNTSQTTKDLAASNQSLVGRLASFMHMNSLFNTAKEQTQHNNEFNLVNKITANGKQLSNNEKNHTKLIQDVKLKPEIKSNTLKTPILVRDSVPFNYPIPIRVQPLTTTTTTTKRPLTSDTVVLHLNTPKVLIPHVHQISRVTKVPVKQIEDFVASKPKLLDLVTKVSRFPIGYDRKSPIEAQVIAAVQKAFEEDDDLKKLLSSAATLK